ncbi:universal stress protein [Actinomarinicola tropica]|uniref:Universal stress protein n=1 Tax=Actinomarinicola tropica TaxID=2789776 RepID=A0A5Q2RHG5_9ACTN|nr:universal stress protein [Actinomarinicola tropica]QGG93991.1 universal stress protein [Actinomarinicola tropica]
MSSVVVGVKDPAAPAVLHAAADLAAALAAPLVVVHVEERNWLVDANVAAVAGAGAGAYVLAAAEVTDRCHLDCEVTLAGHPVGWSFELRVGDPATELAAASAHHDARLVVVGRRRRRRHGPHLGKTTTLDRLVDRTGVPVVVVPPP